VLLPHHLGQGLRTPFAIEYLRRHLFILWVWCAISIGKSNRRLDKLVSI
jgi:hypothetical protein